MKKVVFVIPTVVFFSVILLPFTSFSQKNRIITIKNCQNEERIVTFTVQSRFFWKWVWQPTTSLQKQKILHFSKDFKQDTILIRSQIERIRKILPKNYFNTLVGDMFNHRPDESGIWFTEIFTQQEGNGNLKIFAAYKIGFEETDARIDAHRIEPKIKSIEFIFDQSKLADLQKEVESYLQSSF